MQMASSSVSKLELLTRTSVHESMSMPSLLMLLRDVTRMPSTRTPAASEVVLHPHGRVAQLDVAHDHVLALDEPHEVRPLVVGAAEEGRALAVDDAAADDRDTAGALGVDQAPARVVVRVAAQLGADLRVVPQVCAPGEHRPLREDQRRVRVDPQGAHDMAPSGYVDLAATVELRPIEGGLECVRVSGDDLFVNRHEEDRI